METLSKVKVHSFTGHIVDQSFACQVTFMKQSAYVWVGLAGAAPAMGNLSAAIMSTFSDGSTATSSTSILPIASDAATSFADRLSRRFKMVFFVSYNLPDSAQRSGLADSVELAIVRELKSQLASDAS